MRNFSFSVTPSDTEGVKLVQDLKATCARNGTSFSFVILKALQAYVKENKDGKV